MQAKISSFKNPRIKIDLLLRVQNPLSYDMTETICTWYLKEHAFLLTNKVKGFHQVKDQKKNSPQKSNKRLMVGTITKETNKKRESQRKVKRQRSQRNKKKRGGRELVPLMVGSQKTKKKP